MERETDGTCSGLDCEMMVEYWFAGAGIRAVRRMCFTIAAAEEINSVLGV